jgi:DNA-binding LytR/AlgR family response regulator
LPAVVWTNTSVSLDSIYVISQWEETLDNRFIRVHRSFIVNEHHIEQANATGLVVGGKLIEVSRKYKTKTKICC